MTSLETALDLLNRGFWPVPITAPDDARSLSPGKAPIGNGWGLTRHTPESLRQAFADYLPLQAGIGLVLGDRSGLVDIDVDDPIAAVPTLRRLFPDGLPPTLGWTSTRGGHSAFRWDERLKRYGKAIIKNHPDYPGVEIRIGWNGRGGQFQSVCPPSPGTDGTPRAWTGTDEPAELPKSFFADLDRHLLGIGAKSKHGTRPVLDARPVLLWTPEARAVEYLKTCDPAISGSRGHDKAFGVACRVGPGFNLDPETTLRLVSEVYNPTCQPPWNDRELAHKVEDAYKVEERRGWLLDPTPSTNGNGHTNGHTNGKVATVEAETPAGIPEYDDDPFRLARSYLSDRLHDGILTLRYWLEEWHRWDGQCWRIVPQVEIKAEVVAHVKDEFDTIATATGRPPRKVTTGVVGNTMQALTGLCLLSQRDCLAQPAWLGDTGEESADPHEVIPARNGLIHLDALVSGRQGLLEPTPLYFSPNVLGYAFDPQAPRPDHWLAFLDSLWKEDPESIACLQEWLGYLLTPDTRQQKILVLIGPTRSGKGTISRVVSALIGDRNVCSPTLSSLATPFGASPLIGKTVAIFPDARLSGRGDGQVIVERLLSISGEDSQTIDRKHVSSWTGKLTTRFVLVSNELPRLGDSSGAITARTVILRMTESFLGREDTDLQAKLNSELPSILLWAIAGWERLRRRGRFVQPKTGAEMLEDMKDLSSPIAAFVADECVLGREHSIPCARLFAAWKAWCVGEGKDHPGDAAGFGRSLHAAFPAIRTRRPREGGGRSRYFDGITLGGDF
jgi:putative DNA primase/helicase